jgi:hypothetical protein
MARRFRQLRTFWDFIYPKKLPRCRTQSNLHVQKLRTHFSGLNMLHNNERALTFFLCSEQFKREKMKVYQLLLLIKVLHNAAAA